MKINILGLDFDVIHLEEDTHDDCIMGKADTKFLKIYIRKSMPIENQSLTLLHEILHCISDLCSIKLDERSIQVLSTALYQVLKQNKYLFIVEDENDQDHSPIYP